MRTWLKSLCKGSWVHKVALFSLFRILHIGFEQKTRVCALSRTDVCWLPESVRSLETHDTKLWKGMCTAPDAKRSCSSSTSLLSHCIPAEKEDTWSSEVKQAAGNLCRFTRTFVPTACRAALSSKGLIVPDESSSNWEKTDWEVMMC